MTSVRQLGHIVLGDPCLERGLWHVTTMRNAYGHEMERLIDALGHE